MKIKEAENGGLDIGLTTKESEVLLAIFIQGLIGTKELVLNPETKEFEPTDELKTLLGKVQVENPTA